MHITYAFLHVTRMQNSSACVKYRGKATFNKEPKDICWRSQCNIPVKVFLANVALNLSQVPYIPISKKVALVMRVS